MQIHMGVPFDHIAPTYDSTFTQTIIGQLQRKRVWCYLENIMKELNGFEILELNSGTGEDAIIFGDRGFNIVATDISEEMLKVTQQKVQQFSLQNKVTSHYLDLNDFDETLFNKKFDLVFSNFGGLNCIDNNSMKKLLEKIPMVLSPQGRFIAVIMGKSCLWEILYFLLKFEFKKAFRRTSSDAVIANLNGASSKTWYYSPGYIKKWSAEFFNVTNVLPIGFSIPPSYLDNFFQHRKTILSCLYRIEKKIGRLSMLSNYADHYIIDLKLK